MSPCDGGHNKKESKHCTYIVLFGNISILLEFMNLHIIDIKKKCKYDIFTNSLYTVSPECASGFNEVPAPDSTSEWARNPN